MIEGEVKQKAPKGTMETNDLPKNKKIASL